MYFNFFFNEILARMYCYTPTAFVNLVTQKIKYTPKEIYVFFYMDYSTVDKSSNLVWNFPVAMMYKKDDKFVYLSQKQYFDIIKPVNPVAYKLSKTRPFIEDDKRIYYIKIITKKEMYKGYEYYPNSVHLSKNEKINKMIEDQGEKC